jgi:dephospho-CoA kinase
MKSVGLTGTMASGKSHIAQLIEVLGYPVFNADKEGRRILESKDISSQLLQYFGNQIFTNEQLDRKKLANIVFSNKNELNYLNSIIHPAVIENYKQWANNQISEIVFHESAIIFEHQLEHLFDATICVFAPIETCIQRAIKRDKISKEEVIKRLKNQLSPEEKCKKSDFIIINDDTNAIIPQMITIINKIKS